MAMVRIFVSEWQAFGSAVRGLQAQVPAPADMAGDQGAGTVESGRLQRKWVRKQIGLAIAVAGTMIIFLHGMVQLTA